jgi:glycosyltransferase involved in cell wall biosynthesis
MPRVLHIVADGAPGGGTTNVLALLGDLARHGGFELSFCVQSDSYALRQAEALGVPAFGVDFARSRVPLVAAPALARRIRALAPELVHVHGSRAGFFLACALRGAGFPRVVYTVRGYHFLEKPPGVRELAALAERFAHARADASVHVCRYDQALAERWRLLPAGQRREVIYNGIDPAELPAAADTDPRRIAFLGRLTYQKDPLLLAEIAAGLARAGYRLRVIGGGDMEAEFRARVAALGASDAVELCGELPRRDALAALASAAALVLPSRWEGLPIAPIEAMAIGIPVVAANVSGLPEIVEPGVSGELVAERDAAAYVAALRGLCEQPERRARAIAAGRRIVNAKFLRARNLEAHVALYESLLASPGSQRRARVT